MKVLSERIDRPELFFGLVAPVGVDLTICRRAIGEYFERNGYSVVNIKVTDVFPLFQRAYIPSSDHDLTSTYKRTTSYIKYGNQLRRKFDSQEILAAITISRIAQYRIIHNNDGDMIPTVYILHQFKRKEEIDLLRSVYGRCFFQLSAYSRRGARVDALAQRFASEDNSGLANSFRSLAEGLVQIDENERSDQYGQRVSDVFHDADAIVNHDVSAASIQAQVNRLCDLLFGANFLSPTRDEYGLFAAKAAALRSLDLSRQVGAAIFSEDGEIIAMGSNEVPKAGGGTYWAGDGPDDRDYVREVDSNQARKTQILRDVLRKAEVKNIDYILNTPEMKKSQFMDAIEYGRMVHAEMSALSDAARLGRPTKGATLYCTTFPCHICAKHIVAAGIKRVVFLEPYPKSLASELNSDSIKIEGADRGKYDTYPFVEFSHFYGIPPRRYRETFERGNRKDKNGHFERWKDNDKRPIIDLKFPFYFDLEAKVMQLSDTHIMKPAGITLADLAALPVAQSPPLADLIGTSTDIHPAQK